MGLSIAQELAALPPAQQLDLLNSLPLTLQAALAYDKQTFGFDLAQLKSKLGLDLYGMLKV